MDKIVELEDNLQFDMEQLKLSVTKIESDSDGHAE